MNTIQTTIWLAALCASATAPAMAINEPQDTTRHLPLTETTVKLGEVVVTGLTGSQRLSQSPAPVTLISPRQLAMQPATNIIDAIARQPGVAQITTGSGISKPVIRGLGYNRVVVVDDGIRQEGQQWGDEHGVETDPHSVHSVEILKGPASLMYGSDAMAGVIILHRSPVPMAGDMSANVATGYQTNSGLLDYSLDFAGHKGAMVWDTRYSGKMAHAYKNAYDGYVYGSSLREQSLSQLLGCNYRQGHTHLTLSYYHLTPGIVEGERDPHTGALEVPQGYDPKSYGKPMPYQQIHHYKAVADNSWMVGEGNIRLLLGYQHNRRQEFEDEEHPQECGLDFMLHTVNYDLHYLSPERGGWKFSTGINGMWQRSLNRGEEFLIPAYRLFDYGVFATVSREMGRISLSGGVRVDHRHLHSDALADAEAGGGWRFKEFRRGFDGVSGSVGMAYEVADGLQLKLNLARGFRAPNISELSANGVHEGTSRYELGNQALSAEQSWQMDLGMTYSSTLVSAEVALFANRIDHYVYSRRMADDQQRPVVIDGTPVYQFSSGDARILGGEVSVDVHPVERLHIGNAFSYVNSVQLHQPAESRYLPFTPAPRWRADVRYELICNSRWVDHLYVKVEADCNLRQNHCYTANDTETPTPSYTLLNLYAGADIKSRGRRICTLALAGENLTDRVYQSHLSRLKYLDTNPLTGRRGVYNMGRNVCLKLMVPIAL